MVGAINRPAIRSTRHEARTASTTAIRIPTSHHAARVNRPGPNTTACHATAITNCAANKNSATPRPARSLDTNMIAAIACRVHKLNHAAGNAQSGGIHDGFTRLSKKVTNHL